MERRFLLPGEYHATKKQMSIDTLLGSCVSVCLYNTKNGHAAMNHFLLDRPKNADTNDIGRYGTTATEHIISTLMSIDGSASHYQAQIFGGAAVVDALSSSSSDIGGKNIVVAREVLDAHRIKITKKDIGGKQGRRIKFDTATNTVHCRYMGETEEGKRLAQKRRDMTSRKLRVLIVDDSATVRRLLQRAIESAEDMEIVGQAKDAYEARDMVVSAEPDVLTLDIIMPKLDGLSFLKKLQQYYPKPVVVVSTIAKDNSKVAENAVKCGASEVIDKEALEIYKGMDVVRDILIPKLRSAVRKGPGRVSAD
ncbi:MAG: response regulator [Phycisphaerales bacterium]|jgi:chemotaxis receptor (MCP) glutamine deamidase CheD/AmiR/NasT family two-component response regulator